MTCLQIYTTNWTTCCTTNLLQIRMMEFARKGLTTHVCRT